MPQFQRLEKNQTRIKVLSVDATRAYMLMMRQTGGKLQVLPGDIYVVADSILPFLDENKIQYEKLGK